MVKDNLIFFGQSIFENEANGDIMYFNKENYKKYAKGHMPSSKVLKNAFFAMIFGGSLCVIGQALKDLFVFMDIKKDLSSTLASICLILLSSILTCLGVFDKLARIGGAGLLVPITGFANSIISAGIDNKAEGWILGFGAKIFIIAGPVILYGVLSSALYGLVKYIVMLL